jgi:hypothetical protein
MKHYAPGSFNMIDKDGKEYFLTVEQDDYAENPRDMYDNISTIYCWHTYYIIGDDKPKEKTARDVLADMCEKYTNMEADDIDAASENDMIRELQQAKDIVIKYISCYEHSGITISTAITTYPYNDRWDSGIIGFAFIDKETFEINCGVYKDWKRRAMDIIDSEVKTLDDYFRGEVFRYTLEEKVHVHNEKKCPHCGEVLEVDDYDDWEAVDGCSGFYGDELESNGILDELPTEIQFID